jgi:hypothetical protein
MIYTLRIASVAAVVLAGLVLASVLGFASLKSFGTRDDEELNRILDAPSVVEKFKDSQGDEAQTRRDAISPLVTEAQAFAAIIDPPPPVAAEPRRVPAGSPRMPSRPVGPGVVSAKFDLLGTSYSAANPEESLAYIRLQDGKTYRWVRRGEEIGHLLVKEINRDSIICWDGQGDVPMLVPQPRDTSSLLEGAAGSATASTPGLPPSAADRITGSFPGRPVGSAPTTPTSPAMTEEEQAALGKLVEQIKASGARPEDRATMVNKLISEYRSSRVSPEEAEKVEDLGEELNGSRRVSPLQGRPRNRGRLTSPR